MWYSCGRQVRLRHIFLGGPDETHEEPQDCLSLGRDFKPESAEYETTVVNNKVDVQWCVVTMMTVLLQ
jgi:hypothetical protein